MGKRIGLFGGTFNPVHCGHLKAGEAVQKRFSLDRILFIPSYIPPHKDTPDIASPRHRLKMVELALRPYPCFIPSSIEVEAREKSYSVITLGKIRKLYPRALIFFILGIDAFLEIETWKDSAQLLEQCYFVIISRPGFRLDDANQVLKGRYETRIYGLQEAEVVREELLGSWQIFLLPVNALDISSTDIREKVRRGKSIKKLVPDAVETYIRKNRLYQR